MEIPESLTVYDENGIRYEKSSGVIISGDDHVVFHADKKSHTYLIKLFEYHSEEERLRFYERLRQTLSAHRELFAEIILLKEPFMGYVIVADKQKQYMIAEVPNIQRRYSVEVLRLIAMLVQELEKKQYCICGACDEAFLCRPDVVKLCAPECIFRIGEFTSAGGRVLSRAPECQLVLRLCSAQEFLYCYALMACRMYFKVDAYDRKRILSQLEAVREEDEMFAQEEDEFEFLVEGEETPPAESDDNGIISDEELEKLIFSGRLQCVAHKEYGRTECISSARAEVYGLDELIDITLNTELRTSNRPGISEWLGALREIKRDSYYCTCCRKVYSLKAYFSSLREERPHCQNPECAAEFPRVTRIDFYNISKVCMNAVKAEIDYRDFSVEQLKEIFVDNMYYTYCVDGVTRDATVMIDEFYQEDYYSGRVLIRYSSDGTGGIIVELPEAGGRIFEVVAKYDEISVGIRTGENGGLKCSGEIPADSGISVNTDGGLCRFVFAEPDKAELHLIFVNKKDPMWKEHYRTMLLKFHNM